MEKWKKYWKVKELCQSGKVGTMYFQTSTKIAIFEDFAHHMSKNVT